MAHLIINPNSTVGMTQAMTAAAQRAAPELAFEGWTSHKGPAAIQGPEDGAAAAGPLLDLIDRVKAADGIIIGCFDDTALEAAAARAVCPVLGIGQAAFHYCALRQMRFGVVTILPVSVPVITDNVERYGLMPHCSGVRASDIPVLALERDPVAAVVPILNETRRAVAKDGADAVILGCAGMVHVVEAVRAKMDVPILDPVEVAASAMRWIQAAP